METREKNNQMTPVQAQGVNYFDQKQFENIQRVCKAFASSELVPDMYKAAKVGEGKAIANCVIALDIANRMNANPLMVMQNLVVIYGRTSWSASFLIATVNSCGRFNPLKFKITKLGMLGKMDYEERLGGSLTKKTFDGTKVTDMECYAYTSERGSDEVLEGSTISIRMAVQEGWYTKPGSKWQTMPEQMLRYRAAAFWTRVFAPELSMGMLTAEESQDIHIEDASYEEVETRVEREIEEEANKTTVTMEDGETVDTETGEIVEKPAEKPAEEAPAKENMASEKKEPTARKKAATQAEMNIPASDSEPAY